MKPFKKLLVGISIASICISCANQKITMLSAIDAYSFIQSHPKTIIIDGRDSAKYYKEHIANSIFIDAYSNQVDTFLSSLHKRKTYLLYCTSNNRTDVLRDKMKERGFLHIYIIENGISAWKEAELPLITTP